MGRHSSYGALGRWDEAIQAAREVLRLKPDFPLARNNLRCAKAQKEKMSLGAKYPLANAGRRTDADEDRSSRGWPFAEQPLCLFTKAQYQFLLRARLRRL